MRRLCRIFFSRYAISVLAIIFDVCAISLIVTYSISYYAWFALLAAAVALMVLVSLINRETNPEFKVSWLVIVFLLPIFGSVLYILFYQRRMSKRDSRRLKKITESLSSAVGGEIGSSRQSAQNLAALAEVDRSAAGRALSILKDDNLAAVYSGSRCKYYPQGEEMFSDMMNSFREAKKYIFLEYFIISEGEMWNEIYEVLCKKAREGLDIRVLYDDIGSMGTVPSDFDVKCRRAGISCYRFSKLTPVVSSVHNNRDHRKITIVDGAVAYTGGINIADEYIGRKIRFGHWKDGGIRITGDAVMGLLRQFLPLYDFASRKISDYSAFLSEGSETVSADKKSNTELPLASEGESDGGFYIPYGSGPYPLYPSPVGKNVYMNIINRAERYLYITTPYLVIDYELSEALCMAARRGVDVRIVTPKIADKKIVKIMSKSYYQRLISAGVRIFEYTPGFIHEKLMVSDDSSAVVGTINLDYRSLVHHFENAVWIYGSSEIFVMRDEFMKTLTVSAEVDKAGARLNFIEALIKYAVRLFAPLL